VVRACEATPGSLRSPGLRGLSGLARKPEREQKSRSIT
jgi:hypothetical protein